MAWKGVDPAKWAQQEKERLEAIAKTAIGNLAGAMSRGRGAGGLVPVQTGNLANSVMAEIGKAPLKASAKMVFSAPNLAAITSLKIGDKAFLGYQAGYAHRVNYGFVGTDSLGRTYNQAGSGFVEAIAARWPEFVREAEQQVRGGG